MDICLSQLPGLLADPGRGYTCSPFFSEQLTAFQVWLSLNHELNGEPEQLPIVLQVRLITQVRFPLLPPTPRGLSLSTLFLAYEEGQVEQEGVRKRPLQCILGCRGLPGKVGQVFLKFRKVHAYEKHKMFFFF